MKKVCEAFCLKLEENHLVNDLELLKIKYALSMLSNELSKTIILFFMFFVLGQIKPFLFSLSIFLSIRIFSGGLHLKTATACFIASLTAFILSIFVLPTIPLNGTAYSIILTFSAIAICICSPIPSAKRPIKSKEKYRLNKSIAIGTTFIWTLTLIFIGNAVYVHSGIWVLFLQAIQLISIKGYQYYIKRRYFYVS